MHFLFCCNTDATQNHIISVMLLTYLESSSVDLQVRKLRSLKQCNQSFSLDGLVCQYGYYQQVFSNPAWQSERIVVVLVALLRLLCVNCFYFIYVE